MRPRFNLVVLVLIFAVGTVVATAVFGFLGLGVYDTRTSLLVSLLAAAASRFIGPVVLVLLFSAAAGALGWVALYCLRSDGVHRLEGVAFVPKNYGGRPPFDTSNSSAE